MKNERERLVQILQEGHGVVDKIIQWHNEQNAQLRKQWQESVEFAATKGAEAEQLRMQHEEDSEIIIALRKEIERLNTCVETYSGMSLRCQDQLSNVSKLLAAEKFSFEELSKDFEKQYQQIIALRKELEELKEAYNTCSETMCAIDVERLALMQDVDQYKIVVKNYDKVGTEKTQQITRLTELLRGAETLWDDLAESGELKIGPKFSEKYEQLKKEINDTRNPKS